MITKVIMPQMSLTMRVGIVSKWLKSQGESVLIGEPICTVEGDKAALDIESPTTGVLMRIVAQEGKEFPVKQIMAYIGDPGDVILDNSSDDDILQKTIVNPDKKTPNQKDKPSDNRIKASPVAKRLAKEKGIDLSVVKGTGPNGMIGREDILAFKGSGSPPTTDVSFKDLNSIEKIIAEKMSKSNQDIPHFHLSITCKLDQANKHRKDINKKNNNKGHLTLTDLVIWSVSRSLEKYPDLNSNYQTNKIVFSKNINVGLAVNTPNGLIVVVINEADKKSVFEIAEVRESITKRAIEGKQRPEDISEVTFTISNLGMFGIESFDPIITPGQVGILGVGALTKSLELADNGDVVSIEKLILTLGCDHRAIDGVAGAKFLSEIKDGMEKSTEMFKE